MVFDVGCSLESPGGFKNPDAEARPQTPDKLSLNLWVWTQSAVVFKVPPPQAPPQ